MFKTLNSAPARPVTPFAEAVDKLRQHGLEVSPANDTPGVWLVSGYVGALTTSEVIEAARQL